jgi:UDP-N-acetylmuramyl pentapeptide phosphotransferase/UDP-N-acetylglucosamine-1-phosphate transferase
MRAALLAFVLTAGAVALTRRFAGRLGLLDAPNERSLHLIPTPRGGGLAFPILIAFAVATSPELWRSGAVPVVAFAAAIALVGGVSVYDDLRPLPTLLRLAIHLVAALIVLVGLVDVHLIAANIVNHPIATAMAFVVAAIWIAAVTNAYNFMDGADGMAGLQAVIAGIGWAWLAWLTSAPLVGTLGAVIAGSAAGFLLHNWAPARIFMGDVGSASLGFAFATATLYAAQWDARALVAGAILLWPFLFDTSFTILRRIRRGEQILSAHRTHLYQRLVLAGYSHASVAGLYGGLAALGVLCASVSIVATPVSTLGAVAVVAAAALGLWRLVDRAEQQPPSSAPTRPQPMQDASQEA